jgi:hypothetical protein
VISPFVEGSNPTPCTNIIEGKIAPTGDGSAKLGVFLKIRFPGIELGIQSILRLSCRFRETCNFPAGCTAECLMRDNLSSEGS